MGGLRTLSEFPTWRTMREVLRERVRMKQASGEEDYRDGTSAWLLTVAQQAKLEMEIAFERRQCTWQLILGAHYAKAMSETDPELLREALGKVAATAMAWMEAVVKRTKKPERVRP